MTNFTELYSKATEWASHAHEHLTKDGKPQRYDGEPYTEHLKDVQRALSRFGFDLNQNCSDLAQRLVISAWLHDIIEDTSVTYDDVKREMGQEIADLVYAVTNEPGKNRKERHAATYPKIKNHPDAIYLKLADRIANTERSILLYFHAPKSPKNFMDMYLKEYPKFREALHTPGLADEMWNHLDRLMTDVKYAFDSTVNAPTLTGKPLPPEKIESLFKGFDGLSWTDLILRRKG